MSCVKTATLTIRLDPKTHAALDRLAKATGKTQSDLVREALMHMLAIERFRVLRRRVLAETEKKRGVLTDEEVFDAAS